LYVNEVHKASKAHSNPQHLKYSLLYVVATTSRRRGVWAVSLLVGVYMYFAAAYHKLWPVAIIWRLYALYSEPFTDWCCYFGFIGDLMWLFDIRHL